MILGYLGYLGAAAAAEPVGLSGLAGWVADVVAALGAAGVGLLVALETVFPPIPSEVVLPLAGFLAARGRMPLAWAVVAATAGSLAGAVVLYEASARLGERRVRRILRRLPLVDEDDLDRATSWFDRHGGEAVLIGRFIPVVRSVVSIPAGVERMPRSRFLLYTTLGSGAWNTAFIVLGWALGDRWRDVGHYSGWLNWAVAAAAVVALARFAWRRRDRIAR